MGPRKILIMTFVVLALLDSARAQQLVCSTNVLDHSVRTLILTLHNKLRTRVAIGGARPAPMGKNIYALTYSCSLEQSAQIAAEKCTGLNSDRSERPNIGENVYSIGGTSSKVHAFVRAIATWQNPAGWTGSNLFTNGMRSFAQMAWGSTTLIGCGYRQCRTFHSVVCHYMTEGAKVNEIAYELGRGCIHDHECTTFASSTCDKARRLCRAPAGAILTPTGGPATTASTQSLDCPESPLNSRIRAMILNRHNNLRSRVARSRQIPGHNFKRGTDRMFALRYSCALEATASRLADQCPATPDDPDPPIRGRNLFRDNTAPPPSAGISISSAMTKWMEQGQVFVEGVKLGTAQNLLPVVGHFAQMINAKTYEIGCSYAACQPNKIVLCIYKYARTNDGIPYRPVSTDKGCTLNGCRATFANATCNTTSGLCQLP